MYLKCHRRVKDGKEHRYWSIAEKRRISGRRVVDRHALYLGWNNDSQRAAWLKSPEALDETRGQERRLALFPADRAIPEHANDCGEQERLKDFELRRPHQWGACCAFCRLFCVIARSLASSKDIALARESAVLFWRVTVKGVNYVAHGLAQYEAKVLQTKQPVLRRLANLLGQQVVPIPAPA